MAALPSQGQADSAAAWTVAASRGAGRLHFMRKSSEFDDYP